MTLFNKFARPRRLSLRLALATCALLVALPPAIAYAWSYVVTYAGDGGPITLHSLEYRATPNYFFREWNRVYRTLTPGDTDKMSLFYSPNTPTGVTNSTDNPFIDNRDSIGNERAGCQNVAVPAGDIYNVTCQTTHP